MKSIIYFVFSICLIYLCTHVLSHHQAKENNGKSNFFQFFFGVSSSIRTCNCKCGIPNRRERLLGGTDLRPYEFPWLAQILVKGLLQIPATLINDRYVITSAISIVGFSPYDIKVEFGIYDNCYPEVTSTTLSVSSIIIHPEFQYVSRQNDLALLRLSTIIPYHRRISPICLPTPDERYDHQVATIASWIAGLTSENSSQSSCQPRKVELPIVQTQSCTGHLLESQGCVGVVGSRSVLCKDDAGSAILFSTAAGYYELIGVLSDIQSCHTWSTSNEKLYNYDYYLPMFTKITSYLNWILYNTKDGCYCNKI